MKNKILKLIFGTAIAFGLIGATSVVAKADTRWVTFHIGNEVVGSGNVICKDNLRGNMKFISKNDKRILIGILLVIIFGWLIYLSIQIERVDSNFNGYMKSITRENSQNSAQ